MQAKYIDVIENTAKFFLLIGIFFLPISTALMSIGLTGAAVLAVLNGDWQKKKTFIFNRPALWVPSLLFFLMLLSTAHGLVPMHDRLLAAKKYLYLLFIPFLAWLAQTARMRFAALSIFLSAMLITWALSYFHFYFGILFFKYRLGAVFHDHGSIGIFSAFSVFAFLFLAEQASHYRRALCYLFALSGIWFLFVINNAVVGYVVFSGLTLLFFYHHWQWRGIMLAMMVLSGLLLLAFFFSSAFHARISHVLLHAKMYWVHHTVQDASSTGLRMATIQASAQLLMQHFWLGVGTGSYLQAAATLSWMRPEMNVQPVSCEWLNIAVQTGVLGFIILLFIYIVQWHATYTIAMPLRALAQIAVATVFFASLCDTPMVDSVEAHFYCVFIALCFGKSGMLYDDLMEAEAIATACRQ